MNETFVANSTLPVLKLRFFCSHLYNIRMYICNVTEEYNQRKKNYSSWQETNKTNIPCQCYQIGNDLTALRKCSSRGIYSPMRLKDSICIYLSIWLEAKNRDAFRKTTIRFGRAWKHFCLSCHSIVVFEQKNLFRKISCFPNSMKIIKFFWSLQHRRSKLKRPINLMDIERRNSTVWSGPSNRHLAIIPHSFMKRQFRLKRKMVFGFLVLQRRPFSLAPFDSIFLIFPSLLSWLNGLKNGLWRPET